MSAHEGARAVQHDECNENLHIGDRVTGRRHPVTTPALAQRAEACSWWNLRNALDLGPFRLGMTGSVKRAFAMRTAGWLT